MTKEEFLEQFVLTRVSHKRTIGELLSDAIYAWDTIHNQKDLSHDQGLQEMLR